MASATTRVRLVGVCESRYTGARRCRGANRFPVSYDLHTHSIASDGTLAPADLVRRAHAAGVRVLALTDHDTTDGLDEAAAAARDCGIEFVPGVEVSVSWNGQTVHVVGLRVDPREPSFQQGLQKLRAFREWRAEEIGRRLEHKGIGGALDGARALCRGAILSRTHFARYMVQAGHAASVREVFRHYLVRGRPGYVAGEWAALAEAVGWIRAAGGQAVIAHPARYRLSSGRLRALLEEFRDAGGCALEVVSGSHGPDDARRMAQFARRVGLLASAGSDYHGPEDAWVALGRLQPLPPECSPLWSRWHDSAHASQSVGLIDESQS